MWIDIPSSLYDPEKGHWLYNDYLDELEFADRMGFDGICVNVHHQNGYGLMPSPNIMAAAMIRRTSHAAIVVMGNSIALYNPPVRVAEEFAMLDVMSGGRLVAGFPVGTSMDSNYCYGQTPATLREKYREALKSMHVGQLMILQHFGNIPHALTLKNTQLFAQEVPHMKDLWSEWEDRWYPKPMTETAQTRQAAQAL